MILKKSLRFVVFRIKLFTLKVLQATGNVVGLFFIVGGAISASDAKLSAEERSMILEIVVYCNA